MKARLYSDYSGSSQVSVFLGRSKEPHFVIEGADIEDLDNDKVSAYLNGCDWTDKDAKGWITPHLRCDDFLKDHSS
jgi:hypothetical protein